MLSVKFFLSFNNMPQKTLTPITNNPTKHLHPLTAIISGFQFLWTLIKWSAWLTISPLILLRFLIFFPYHLAKAHRAGLSYRKYIELRDKNKNSLTSEINSELKSPKITSKIKDFLEDRQKRPEGNPKIDAFILETLVGAAILKLKVMPVQVDQFHIILDESSARKWLIDESTSATGVDPRKKKQQLDSIDKMTLKDLRLRFIDLVSSLRLKYAAEFDFSDSKGPIFHIISLSSSKDELRLKEVLINIQKNTSAVEINTVLNQPSEKLCVMIDVNLSIYDQETLDHIFGSCSQTQMIISEKLQRYWLFYPRNYDHALIRKSLIKYSKSMIKDCRWLNSCLKIVLVCCVILLGFIILFPNSALQMQNDIRQHRPSKL